MSAFVLFFVIVALFNLSSFLTVVYVLLRRNGK